MSTPVPSTIRIWQYDSIKGGLEKNLKLNTIPAPTPKADQNLIRVLAVSLNPVDYKPAEIPYIGSLIRPTLATPGIDIAGVVVTPASDSPFQRGQLVFGACGTSPIAAGGLSEYCTAPSKTLAAIPDGVDPLHAASSVVAGLTAYQTLAPHVKTGDHVFINGGSGGTGIFGIQIAKALGCHVTTTCSGANVALCSSLGADEVLDYKSVNVLDELIAKPYKFAHAVDNAGHDKELWWRCDEYLAPNAQLIKVAGEPSLGFLADTIKAKIPTFLGGIKGNVVGFFTAANSADLATVAGYLRDGKVKAVIDEVFEFEQAPKAFEKLKTGRAKGKIVVDVATKTYQK